MTKAVHHVEQSAEILAVLDAQALRHRLRGRRKRPSPARRSFQTMQTLITIGECGQIVGPNRSG